MQLPRTRISIHIHNHTELRYIPEYLGKCLLMGTDQWRTIGERHSFIHEHQAKAVIDKYLQLKKEGYPKTVEYPEGQE